METLLTVSGFLLGFLAAGFWWRLERELIFKPKDRHFTKGSKLLLVAMGVLAIVGVIRPLRFLASANPNLLLSYRGVILAMIAIGGFMVTELVHYSILFAPKPDEETGADKTNEPHATSGDQTDATCGHKTNERHTQAATR